MKYKSKSTEIEAMQWVNWPHVSYLDGDAAKTVAWVNANGGEARFDDGHRTCASCLQPPRAHVGRTGSAFGCIGFLRSAPQIVIRTINGWAYAKPGHYVVKGTATFCPHVEYGQPGHVCDGIVDFYPCDPETFGKRWEPA